MRQRAQVLKVAGDEVFVEMQDPGEVCGNCKGCIKLSSTQRSKEELRFYVRTKIKVKEGDEVLLEGSNANLIRIIALLYGVPFLGLALGYGIGFFFLRDDARAGLSSLLGLLLFVILARFLARRIDGLGEIQIVAIACSPRE